MLEVTINRTYDIPQNLEFSEGIISWDEMISATSYNLKVNGVVLESDNNTYSLETISDTLYEVTVQAVYQSETSSWSNHISFHTYDVVGDSYQKQFNRLLPINLDLNLPYNIDIEAFYVDEETYSINHLIVDGLRISFDYSFLSTLNVGEHTITLITDAIRIDVAVDIFEEEDSTIVSSNTVDYQGVDITFSFMLFDSVIDSINGSDITSNDYIINGDELTISSSFIDALLLENPDRRTVIFSYTLASDENISIGYLFINTQTD